MNNKAKIRELEHKINKLKSEDLRSELTDRNKIFKDVGFTDLSAINFLYPKQHGLNGLSKKNALELAKKMAEMPIGHILAMYSFPDRHDLDPFCQIRSQDKLLSEFVAEVLSDRTADNGARYYFKKTGHKRFKSIKLVENLTLNASFE